LCPNIFKYLFDGVGGVFRIGADPQNLSVKSTIQLTVILLIGVVSCSKDPVKKIAPPELKGGFAIGEKFNGVFMSKNDTQAGGSQKIEFRSDGTFADRRSISLGAETNGTWMIDVGGYINCFVEGEVVGKYKKEANGDILKIATIIRQNNEDVLFHLGSHGYPPVKLFKQ